MAYHSTGATKSSAEQRESDRERRARAIQVGSVDFDRMERPIPGGPRSKSRPGMTVVELSTAWRPRHAARSRRYSTRKPSSGTICFQRGTSASMRGAQHVRRSDQHDHAGAGGPLRQRGIARALLADLGVEPRQHAGPAGRAGANKPYQLVMT